MSFILDALKKSEMERQRQAVPGLMDAGIAAPRRRFPVWAVAIAVLLGINLVIVSWLLLRATHPARQAATAPPLRGSAAAAGAEAAPAPPPAHFSPLDAAPVYAPEIPVPNDEQGGDAPPDGAPGDVRRAEPVLSTKGAAPLRDAGSDPDEILPTINEMNLSGAQALPELHLDVHVYATSAADRFVYVNMRKYREGGVLQEGPAVERIRRDGVVLNYQGLRFLLPRQ